MRRIAVLGTLLLVLAGCCSSPEERAAAEKAKQEKVAAEKAAQEQAQAEYSAKINSFKTKKCLNVRVNDNTIDFVMDDGSIVTVFATAHSDGRSAYSRIGVK